MTGDLSHGILDTWEGMKQFGNNSLYVDVYNVTRQAICPTIYTRHGIPIIFKDLSSNAKGIPTGHPEWSHDYGRASDIWYPGHEQGELHIEATRDWIEINHLCFYDYTAYIGPEVAKTLYGNRIPAWVTVAPPGDSHEWKKGDEASHIHNNYTVGLSLPRIDWFYINELCEIVHGVI